MRRQIFYAVTLAVSKRIRLFGKYIEKSHAESFNYIILNPYVIIMAWILKHIKPQKKHTIFLKMQKKKQAYLFKQKL